MKKGLSIFLAFSFMALSFQPGLATHYCKGELAESKIVAGFGKAGCDMQGGCQVEGHSPADSISRASCCQDFFLPLALDTFTGNFLLEKDVSVLTATCFNIDFLFPFQDTSRKVSFPIYKAPPGISNVELAAIGVFLI